ncbi:MULTISPECIES: NAD(P)/FAD-dependent oxidoreductase [Caproicibacterium]|uniref:FAD-binding protein n=1 Tax=Caproicibacterium argilliputei TaxID=3030016 RepID=A0AA97DBR8_9FIRM|nr:FAD-binding protein [Caproicibacterium argilliputei]WOC32708.1 FAD-binding protein [Caproicibacterium argilliputei]
MKKNYDVLVIGAGPAGIFTALELDRIAPEKAVLVVDSGSTIADRRCPARTQGRCMHCKTCSIMNGWAGAGAFSDGKLSLCEDVGGNLIDYMSREKAQELIHYCDETYLHFGAPEKVFGLGDRTADKIAYDARRQNIQLIRCPVRHMGTEYSYQVLKAMYDYLAQKPQFTFLPHTTAESIIVKNGRAAGAVLTLADGSSCQVEAENVVAAPGRGGAAWLSHMAAETGLQTTNNEVDIGVRVEVPNGVMDHLTKSLYEAKLVYYSDTFENKVRTFCMNPGGIVSEEHYDGPNGGLAVVNGHSYAEDDRHSDNTNFALLVSTKFTEPFNQPIEYGRYIAKLGNMLTGGGIMVQRLGDLLLGRRSDASRLSKSTTVPTLKTAVPGDLSFVLPHRHLTSIVESLKAFDALAPGLYSKNTLLYGVEVKFYSSKVEVDSHFSTVIPGLYAIGDGAGITRGLMQASVTGVVVARTIHADTAE